MSARSGGVGGGGPAGPYIKVGATVKRHQCPVCLASIPCDGKPTKERDLRDKFAMAAFAMAARHDFLDRHSDDEVAAACYRMADAMLWERDKT